MKILNYSYIDSINKLCSFLPAETRDIEFPVFIGREERLCKFQEVVRVGIYSQELLP